LATHASSDSGFSLVDILVAIAVISILAAITLPLSSTTIAASRFRGDGQAVSNLAGLAKMKASSRFTRARLRIDLDANSYSIEVWNKASSSWVTEGGVRQASRGVQFSFGALDEPPPDTQAAIGFSDPCTDADGDDIDDTACIVFNSRGIPIDADGDPIGGHGIYLTDGSTGVYGVTVTETPLIRFWWSPAHEAHWQELQ
jgi:prepilin-type N-terminal cleavage/methylation domain-containing protein